MCKRIIWVNNFVLFGKIDHYRVDVRNSSQFIYLYYSYRGSYKGGDLIILDINNSINYS